MKRYLVFVIVSMRIEQNYLLERHNTFRLPVRTRWFVEYDNDEELSRLLRDVFFQSTASLSIGEGSNLLFINDFNGIVIHSRIKGFAVIDNTPDSVLLRVGAAEHWDDVVAFAVSNGWGGIENLSHIPGTVGAAAIQNIGAYSVEIKDVIETVETVNQRTGRKRLFSNKECRYGYRCSFFKETGHDPFIITAISLRLQKKLQFILDYGNLTEALKGREISLQTVRDTIIEVRRSKLPDPDELGNAGSFFMNPIIPQSQFEDLKNRYATIPFYPATEGYKKIPAAWLIEQCGFKGKREGAVGVYEKQALILVNYGGATGAEIAAFAEQIRQSVYDKFGLRLVPEVKYICLNS